MEDSISQVPGSSQEDVSLKIRETDKLPLRQESETAVVPLARENCLLFLVGCTLIIRVWFIPF